MTMRKILVLLLSLCCVAAYGQRSDMRRGNRQFRKGRYMQADLYYRKALIQDSTWFVGRYNLGNTLYREGDIQGAAAQYAAGRDAAMASPYAASYLFNMGDAAIAAHDWQSAVTAFGQCLLLTPDDYEAKENYIYARNMLLQNQQNQDQNQDQDQQDQNQDQQQNQNQDQQDQQNQDQNQDQQNQDQDQDQNQDQQQNQGSQGQAGITQQQANQMLQAIQEKERQTQEKVDAQRAAAQGTRRREKNW